ncbi:baseplate assembly protein, partial [Salmonella enterica]|nr:baseplate assembly protein [Salmonella enterica]
MATVDLSQLPQPAIIEALDFEVILAEIKHFMVGKFPEERRPAVAAALELESEPLNIIAQAFAWRELLLRQRINDGAAACMLSHSVSADLDNIAGNMGTRRLVITPATDTTDAVMESDTALRMRAQAAFDGLSVAGPTGAYEYFARSASGNVADAKAVSPSPAVVVISVLSTEGDGTATPELLATVTDALSAEDRRPVGDRLTVQSAEIVSYNINARLFFYPGPESEPIQNAAHDALRAWITLQGKIGRDVARSAIMAALHVQGIQRVEL